MKKRSLALLLALTGSFMLLLSSLTPSFITSAQRETRSNQDVESSKKLPAPAPNSPCGTQVLEKASKQGMEQERSTSMSVSASSVCSWIEIPVHFHIIQDSSGNGDVPEDVLDEQIRILNVSFGGATGGVSTVFSFRKVGVTRGIWNTAWHNMVMGSAAERYAKTALRQGGANVLNFYTIGNHIQPGQTYPISWGTLPEWYASNPVMDGVVCPSSVLPNGGSQDFGLGDIAVHEVGHWLGLLHTFQGGCSGTDYVTDTPAHKEQTPGDNIVGGCPSPSLDTCASQPGLDPIHNFMQNTSDSCKYEFTEGQADRMCFQYNTYRRPSVSPTASVAWVAPAEFSWGPSNTMTVAGYAQNGYGGVQMVWRDATENGPWNVVGWQPTPNPADNTWSNTIPSSAKCHEFWVYVNYAGIRSPTFVYKGVDSGYCNESVNVIWIQPQSSAGFGPPGSLIIAGRAAGAPAGTQVYVQYRDLTARTGWVYHPYAPLPNSEGYWFTDIPNADYSHVYEVYATYSSVSDNCNYWGGNQISWCQ